MISLTRCRIFRLKRIGGGASVKLTEAKKKIVNYNGLTMALPRTASHPNLSLRPWCCSISSSNAPQVTCFPNMKIAPRLSSKTRRSIAAQHTSPEKVRQIPGRNLLSLHAGYPAGDSILLIGEADILDIVNRAQLFDFLLFVRQDFDTILVFGTSDEVALPVPEIQVLWLKVHVHTVRQNWSRN
jgi:hypothetical protein